MVRVISGQSRLKTTPKSAGALLAGLLFATLAAAGAEAPFTGPVLAGHLAEPANLEASGLAPSHRAPGVLWTHNDSGGAPVLFALNADGSLRGRARLAGVVNQDWEDLASFELDGRAWLLVADIGDNLAVYTQRQLHLVAEPDPAELAADRELNVRPAYTINFIYPDGPRDAESVAVDPQERAIYILSKREPQPRLYRLPLRAAAAETPAVAEFLGVVPHLPQPGPLQRYIRRPREAFRGAPTAMGFAPDGSRAFVLVYGGLLLFPRTPGETWAQTLARPPVPLPPFDLPQAEGACFSADGRSLWLCSEETDLLLRYDRRAP